MNTDDLKALAEKAKAWRPERECGGVEELSCGIDAAGRGVIRCDHCLGAQRACKDIAESVDDAIRDSRNYGIHPDWNWRHGANAAATRATRIASYFGSESNPVAEFAAAVMEFCK